MSDTPENPTIASIAPEVAIAGNATSVLPHWEEALKHLFVTVPEHELARFIDYVANLKKLF